MSDKEFDSELEQQMMDDMGKTGQSRQVAKEQNVPVVEIQNTTIPAWKQKLLDLKKSPLPAVPANNNGSVISGEQKAPPPTAKLIMRGDPGAPQNLLEADIEADRRLGRAAVDEAVEKERQQILNGEALYIETIANESHDKERFQRVFIDVINTKFLGKTLDETEAIIQEMHETLFDVRTGIQAGISFRNQLLKDTDAADRAERLKKDWLYKPKSAEKKEKKASSSKESKPKKSMFETMRDSMMAIKGISKEEAEAKLKAKGFTPDMGR